MELMNYGNVLTLIKEFEIVPFKEELIAYIISQAAKYLSSFFNLNLQDQWNFYMKDIKSTEM